MSKLITLEEWLRRTFGQAVSIKTVRRWAKNDRIIPAPQKIGRAYFVTPDARYTEAPTGDLTERLRRDYANAARH